MIFKTFDSNIDKISSKWGMFGRSFNDIGTAIRNKIISFNEEFEQTGKIINSWKNSDSIWSRLYLNKEDVKKQLIDVDKLIPKIDENKASKILEVIKSIENGTNEEIKSLQELYDTGDKTNQWIAEYGQSTKDQIRSTEGVIKANQQARASALAHNEAIKAQTFSAKAGKVALQALAMAGNMIAMWGITEVISAIHSCITASDRLQESAKDLGSQFSSTKSDIEGYKSRINDLRQTISDSSSSYEDTYSARKELLAIQDEMIEKFGSEAEAVELVTSAIHGQTEALDSLTKQKWQETVNEFINGSDKKWTERVGDSWANLWSGASNNFDRMIKEMENTEVSFRVVPRYNDEGTYEEFSKKLKENFGASITHTERDDVFTLSGDLDGIYDQLLNIQSLATNMGIDDSFLPDLSRQADEAKKTLESYQEIYSQHILYDKIFDSDAYEKSFNDINNAYKEYQEAFASGNDDAIETAKQSFAEVVQGAIEGISDQSVIDYFNSMYPDLQEVVGGWEFEVKFKTAIDDDSDNFENEVKDAIGKFENSNSVLNFHSNTATQEQIDAYAQLNSIADEYSLTLEQLIAKLEQLGLISTNIKLDLRNRLLNLSSDTQNVVIQDLAIDDWVKSLTDEEANMANSTAFDEALKRQMEGLNDAALSAENYSAALEEVKASQNGIGNDEIAILTFEDIWADSFTSENDAVKELGNTLLGLAEKGRLTKETFKEADSTAGDYFQNLGVSADEAVSKINKLVDESSQLSSMSSQISSMAEALGTKQENGFVEANTLAGFDVEVRGLESWDRFQEVLGSTTSSYEECQEAANALATEWVNSSDFLAQLTEQNEEYYKTQLESMGIENYEEVISYAHALNEAREVLAQSSLELGTATYDEIEALIAEGTYSELTANMILALYDAKIAEQAATLDTSADCQNLINLAGDTDRTSQSIQLLIQLMNIYNGLESGVYDNNAVARAGALTVVTGIKAQLESLANNEVKDMEINPNIKLGSKGKSSAGKAGKDAGKTLKDKLKEELSDLDSVISGITGRIDDQISSINEQKSAALESIDAQKEALEEAKDAAVEALEAQRDAELEVVEAQKKALENQIKLIDKQIKQKQDEIDAINDAAEARKRELDLQKAQYDLERMQNQRTKLVYSEEKGIHYEADTSGIRDAKEAVDDAKRQIEIANIQKEIDLLEDQKDLLNESLDLLSEQEDQINYHYDNLISQTEKYYDQQIKALEKQRKSTESYFESIIKNLENSKSKYQELTEILEKAELSAKLKQLGIDEEALLNGSEEEFNKLKDAYMNIVTQLNSGNDEVLDSLRELSGYDGTAPTMLEESNTELNTMNDNLATSNTNVGTVNSSLADTATKTNDVATNVSTLNDNLSQVTTIITEEQSAFDALRQMIDEVITAINEKIITTQTGQATTALATTTEIACYMLLRDKILEVKDSLDIISNTVTALDATPVNNLTTAFQALYDQLLLVSATLGAGMEGAEEGAVGGIASAIQALNEISLEEGIIAQFTNLKTAIDEVTSAIGGGSGGDNEGSAGGEGSGGSGGKTGGGQSGGKGSKGEGSGGGDSLTGAIETMGETAKEVIGEPDAEGDGTVIGEFGALETAVTDVTSAIGGGESEGGEGQGKGSGGEGESGEGNLISSIKNLGETTEETLGEPGGDGVIGRFEQFKQPIQEADEHVHSISDGLAAIDGQEVECTITVNVKMNGGLPGAIGAGMNLGSATYEAKYLGNAHVEGTALASGNWAVQANEQSALLGEVGYEIIVRNGKFFTVGDNGPEMFPIKKGDIVFNHQQSVELLKNGHTSGRGKAYADGTVGGGKILTKDGEILRPLQPGDRAYDLMQKFDTYFKSIDGNLDILTVNARARYEKQMDELAKHVTNVSNVTNNRNVQPVINGGINITCPGITSQEVARQVGVELDNMFNGMHLDAEQRSRMR